MIESSKIEEAIKKAIRDAEVEIRNPAQDGLHFEAVVVSAQFEGKTLMEQHQMVMQPLSGLFSSSLHALSLKTYTPDQWKGS